MRQRDTGKTRTKPVQNRTIFTGGAGAEMAVNYGNLGMVKGIATGSNTGNDTPGDDHQAEERLRRVHSARTGDERRGRGNRQPCNRGGAERPTAPTAGIYSAHRCNAGL